MKYQPDQVKSQTIFHIFLHIMCPRLRYALCFGGEERERDRQIFPCNRVAAAALGPSLLTVLLPMDQIQTLLSFLLGTVRHHCSCISLCIMCTPISAAVGGGGGAVLYLRKYTIFSFKWQVNYYPNFQQAVSTGHSGKAVCNVWYI